MQEVYGKSKYFLYVMSILSGQFGRFVKIMFFVAILVDVFVIKYGYCQRWQERKPLVKIQQGTLEGVSVITQTSNKLVNSFLGIPYAIPPVGHYRFLPPEKHPGWNGTYKAIDFGANCAHLSSNGSISGEEDCLFLNIWTPVQLQNAYPGANIYGLIPVVIFFEGLNFYTSSTPPISAQEFATEGVVIVSVNYRLNIFGFFCLGNGEARGNLGLLDQYFAMLWVKSNIKHFGGDPGKITLFGHSAGATSVALHMISPRTAGLFQRAIISSGSAVSPWQSQNDPIAASKQLLNLLGCGVYHPKAYFKCLRAKTTEHILKALREYSQIDDNNHLDMFLPIVDNFLSENNRYLPIEPIKAFQQSQFAQVPLLSGVAKSITYSDFNQDSQHFQYFLEKFKIPEILKLYRVTESESFDLLVELINWKYFLSNENARLFDEMRNMEFDAKVEAPHYLQLSYLTSYVQPIFVYFMDEAELFLNSTDESITTDLFLLFGPTMFKDTETRRFTKNEARLSSYVKNLWINFINFGNPTPQSNRLRQWQKYTPFDPYVEEFYTKMTAKLSYKEKLQRISFWNQLLPKVAGYKKPSDVPNQLPKFREANNSSYKHAMFTLIALVAALLVILAICIFLLKKRLRERDIEMHFDY